MSDQVVEKNSAEDKPPKWVMPVIVVVCVVSLAGLGLAWRASTFAQDSRRALNSDLQAMKQAYDKNLSTLGDRLAEAEKTNTNLQGDLNVVVKKLQITQGQLKKARDEAENIRDDEIQQLSSMDSEMKDQLAMKANNEDVKLVNGQVDVVRTDLDSTKKDLQMARSEMGTLIAKNHDDIEILRRMGERDYVEFTLARKINSRRSGTLRSSSTAPTQRKISATSPCLWMTNGWKRKTGPSMSRSSYTCTANAGQLKSSSTRWTRMRWPAT